MTPEAMRLHLLRRLGETGPQTLAEATAGLSRGNLAPALSAMLRAEREGLATRAGTFYARGVLAGGATVWALTPAGCDWLDEADAQRRAS